MKASKGLFALALIAGMGASALVSAPAQAAGDTARQWGCAAHWRNTATWNECVNSPGIHVQLQTDCNWWEDDYYGVWRWVKGSIDPSDRYECQISAISARNAFY